jgi:hypothetical protein
VSEPVVEVLWGAICAACMVPALVVPTAFRSPPGVVRTLHYAANGNFAHGRDVAASAGFDLADVGSVSELSELPRGAQALVFVGQCGGVDARFRSTVTPFVGRPQVFGFYLMDDPDPTGRHGPRCPPVHLKAESDWLHAHDPGAKTFIVLMDLGTSTDPNYRHSYTPANSHVDLYGLDAYPCRTDLGGCDFKMIVAAVRAAEAAGIPRHDLIPIYQAFGGGSYVDDTGGRYALPTRAQAEQLVRTWASVLPDPVFDYTYSWGEQDGDTALSSARGLRGVFVLHNRGAGPGDDFALRHR